VSERNPEDDYFAQLNREQQDKLKAKLEAEQAQLTREQLRQQFHHRCGKCGTHMNTHPFRGTEIEVCPSCGAVLLDNGELEQLAGKDQSGVLAGIVELFGRKK
jgi:rubrerythrin